MTLPDDSTSPDYTHYSVADLLDAQRWIDADAYPERARALEQELQNRAKEAQNRHRPPNPYAFRSWRRPIALVEMAGGAVGAIYAASWLWNTVFVNPPKHSLPVIVSALMFFVVTYSLSVAAGWLLLNNRTLGKPLSIAAQSVQLLRIGFLGVEFCVFAPGAVEAYFRSGTLGAAFHLPPHYTFRWGIVDSPVIVGINFVALAILLILTGYAARQHDEECRTQQPV